MSVFWFLLGAVVGFDAVLAYAWLSTRAANRSVTRRVGQYTGAIRTELYLADEHGLSRLVHAVTKEQHKRARRGPSVRR